jgi:hypothetical protein
MLFIYPTIKRASDVHALASMNQLVCIRPVMDHASEEYLVSLLWSRVESQAPQPRRNVGLAGCNGLGGANL